MKKEDRHEVIKKLIRENKIRTQDELVRELRSYGFDIGQSTVSRDIKELHLVKEVEPGGSSYYIEDLGYKAEINSQPEEEPDSQILKPSKYETRIRNIFRDSVLRIDSAYFLIILHTLPGMAQAAAHAIDTLALEEIAGTIAGDDTIFVAVKREQDIARLTAHFRELIE